MDPSYLLKAEYFPYVVLFCNSIVFGFFRRLLSQFNDPAFVKVILEEMIATMELCTGVTELNTIYERQGKTVFVLVSILCFYWWYREFEWTQASPHGPIEGFLYSTGRGDHVQVLIGQLLGAVGARHSTRFIWSQKFIVDNMFTVITDCQSPLMTSLIMGMVIEYLCSVVHRFFYLRCRRWRCETSLGILALVTAMLRLVALEKTGGYFNGILASSMAFGCKPHGYMEHILVYWVASLAGGSLGRYISSHLDQVPYA